MPSFRLLGLAFLLVASIAVLIPTLYPAADLPGLPDSHLHLGVELRGGTAIRLEVMFDEMVQAEIEGDVAYLRSKATASGLDGATIRLSSPSSLEIVADAPRIDIVSFVAARLGSYTPTSSIGTVHRFALSEDRQRAIRDRAMVQVVERFEGKISEACAEGATVEALGSGLVGVQVPGRFELDPQCP